jgi:hypothetical protein
LSIAFSSVPHDEIEAFIRERQLHRIGLTSCHPLHAGLCLRLIDHWLVEIGHVTIGIGTEEYLNKMLAGRRQNRCVSITVIARRSGGNEKFPPPLRNPRDPSDQE